MVGWIYHYPYFFANILLLIIVMLIGKIFLNQHQFKLVFLGGMANTPCFLFLVFLEGEYWNPVRLGGWKLGIEDALISFIVGALVWLSILISKNQKIFYINPDLQTHKRYGLLAGFSVGFFLIFIFAGFQKMTSLILSISIIGLFLFFRQKKLRVLAVKGIWKFPVFYLILVKFLFFLWPGFLFQWNLSSLWGTPILGIPLGEYTWALAFGFYWPLFVGYLLEVEVVANDYSVDSIRLQAAEELKNP